ncbi:WhiB family transcriptional regulator [Pseudonocardia parietis]|uniref:Transcriptional regulator WhiB n=1 Tax=Pseudonocardia parietis TaxID=570936 RepID=A0ABS4VVB1_9PSEU|nr:WhiB family transcriptional regulator [Pseudonocardia parietis]MBP2367863.1 WhiB family redox-sensing transcriptional regulator [Pseudonocardia parietis]
MSLWAEPIRTARTPHDDRVLPCRSTDDDLWFAESPDDAERAKALCRTCPVRGACLATALRRGEPWGVWGGEIFDRGSVVSRKRPRGRPRKVDAERGLDRTPAGVACPPAGVA